MPKKDMGKIKVKQIKSLAGIKDIHGAPVGDTITHIKPKVQAESALPGFKNIP